MESRDHDILIRIDANLNNLVNKFSDHIVNDKIAFDKHDKRLAVVEKTVWVFGGVVLTFDFIIRVFIK